MRCLRHLDRFRDWFSAPAHAALQEALLRRPSLAMCAVHPYLNTAWPAERKLDVVRGHYDLLVGPLAFLRFAPPASITLSGLGRSLQVRLDKHGKFEHEGELTLGLFDGSLRLYSLAFTLGQAGAQRVAFVGALQGLGSPEALETYRVLTHALHGLRPRDLQIAAFRTVCRGLGVERILAIADSHRVSSSSYFESSAQVCTSYDSAWRDAGGTGVSEGFIELTVQRRRRATAEIPSRKRAQYRRRYAMLDALDLEIDDALQRAAAA